MRPAGPLDVANRRRHKLRNAAQALLLLGGMLGMLAVLAWLLAGPVGVLWVLVVGAVTLAFRPRVPPSWMLAMYGARPLPAAAAPDLHRLLEALAERAELSHVPRLHYVATPMLNAFAVGDRDEAAVAVTDGLLRRLRGRELAGVLAHELSHVRANDLWVMTLSDTVGRLTHGLAYAGLFLLLIGAPLTVGETLLPLLVALVLTVVPTVVTLLQLALSRAREYDADLDAAAITGDPVGLARALERLEHHEGRLWERVVVPRRRGPDPALLRTHPPTAERVRRLLSLVPDQERARLGRDHPVPPPSYPRVERPVRLRLPGVWW